jgi:Fe-S-cluster-containing hydrogenase component 2
VANPKLCTGCLICELACSFHHTKRFSRSHSSIKVRKFIFSPEEGVKITIFHKKAEGSPTCDFCHGEDYLKCVQFCPENVLEKERSLT